MLDDALLHTVICIIGAAIWEAWHCHHFRKRIRCESLMSH